MRRIILAALVASFVVLPGQADGDDSAKPLKALLITGGGWHDYKALNPVITKKIAGLARVEFTVHSGLDILNDPKFADNFDIVVYNFCFDNPKNKEMVENALKVTRDGKPTVLIHCAMHTFRSSEDWTDCCGMRTRVHDPYRAFAVIKADKNHPITRTLPDEFDTPGDEMYQTIKLGERSTVLLKGKAPKANVEHVVCWVSNYGKGKVFATTLGHDLRTVNLPVYHRLLTNGLLWACGKLDDKGQPLTGYGKN
jgi:type 1 glutamine amidotransferase